MMDTTQELRNWIKTNVQHSYEIYNEPTTIVFTKKNGEERTLICTLDMEEIPTDKAPKGTGTKPSDEILRVYDIENEGWRSFAIDSVKSMAIGNLQWNRNDPLEFSEIESGVENGTEEV